MNRPGESSLEKRLLEVMDRHEGQLIRYASHITRDADLARDVVQDTFLKWIESHAGEGEPRSPTENRRLQAWLFTVCRNRALDMLRKDKGMNRLSSESDRAVSNSPSPPQAAETDEECRRVIAALSELTTKEQEAIRLKYQSGFTYRQIAEITGNSLSHVGVLIHTGLQKLRRRFKSIGILSE